MLWARLHFQQTRGVPTNKPCILPHTPRQSAVSLRFSFIAVLLLASIVIHPGEVFGRKKNSQHMAPDQARAAVQAFGVGSYVRVATTNGQHYAGQIAEIQDNGFALKTQDNQPPTTLTFEQITAVKKGLSPQEKKKNHTFALVCFAIGIAGMIAGITSGY